MGQYGAAGVAAVLVEAALTEPRYDAQCEDARDGWIVDMICRAGLRQRAFTSIQDVANRLPADRDYRDCTHRCAIVRELAQRAVPGARHLLYSMLARVPDTAGVIGDADIVKLDGADGLVFVARRLGQWLSQDSSFWVDDHALAVLDERDGCGSGRALIEAAATTDSDIARFLSALDHPDGAGRPYTETPASQAEGVARRRRAALRDITAQQVIARVRAGGSKCYWLTCWARHASAEARQTVFAALLAETSPPRIARFLRAFVRVGPPCFDGKLHTWVDAHDNEVRWEATRVLAQVNDPRVRTLALHKLAPPTPDVDAIRLLTNSYQPGDHRIIEDALQPLEDKDDRHTLLSDVVAVFEANVELEGSACLCFVYEHTPCATCRKHAVALLDRLGTLPDWIAEEAQLDADERIRLVADKYRRRRGEAEST